ncbi:MAG: O-antigen ligase family protein, partial [Patescibacteria group bacterium]
MLGVASGIFGVLAATIFVFKKKQRRAAVIILGALFLLGGAIMMVARLPEAQQRIPSLTAVANIQNIFTESTAQTRLMSWRIAWQGFMRYPWLGIGMGNYEVIFNQYYNPEFLRYGFKETIWDKPHNWLLEIAVSAGIFGTLAYLALYGVAGAALISKARQEINSKDKWAQVILAGGLLAYFVQDLFLFETFNALLIFFVILSFISASLLSKEASTPVVKKLKGAPIILIAAAGVTLWLFWQVNYLPLRASYYLALSENAGRYSNSPAVWAKNLQASLRVPSYLKLESAVLAVSTLDTMSKQNIIKDGKDIKDAALALVAVLAEGIKKYPRNYIYPVWAGQGYLVLGEYVEPAYFAQG